METHESFTDAVVTSDAHVARVAREAVIDECRASCRHHRRRALERRRRGRARATRAGETRARFGPNFTRRTFARQRARVRVKMGR